MRIDPEPTFTTDVKLSTPGLQELATIRVTWRLKDRAQLKEWAARQLEVSAEKGFTLVEVEAETIDEVIESWDGPVDVDGIPVPYSLEALQRLMNRRPAAGYELYLQFMQAIAESRLKN